METSNNNIIKTKPNEFVKFHNLLIDSFGDDFKPHYFPVKFNDKAPDSFEIMKRTGQSSWKNNKARLSYKEALKRLQQGKNVGIAGTDKDWLHITDIDDWNYLHKLPTQGLVCVSRSRIGRHYFGMMKPENKTNIPTDSGEVRCVWQYVLVAGSYVPTTEKDIDEEIKSGKMPKQIKNQILNDKLLGVYSVHEKSDPPIKITNKDLPDFFQIKRNQINKNIKFIESKKVKIDTLPENCSALYKLKLSDIIDTMPNTRTDHPLHESTTSSNWSISNDGEVGHCWRHNVSLNAIQFLCVKCGYASCEDAGTGHNNQNPSTLIGDYGAIWEAWKEAKLNNYIPKTDPVPIKAMWHIAIKHNLCKKPKKIMPNAMYNEVINIIKRCY